MLPYNHKKYGENVARMAHVKASSERRYYRQSAEAAIDGAVDGLIRVSPSECTKTTAIHTAQIFN